MTERIKAKPPFFAQKFIRLLTKTASALELGPSVCWMLAVIVSQEDAKRYSEPAKWYYSQLMPLCGFTSPKQMRAAIQTAVDLGWLKYVPGRKGKPCYFSACIPDRFANLDSAGCDESQFTSDSASESEVNNSDSLTEEETNRQRKRKRNGHASTPSPNPNSKEGARPSLSDVKRYAQERSSRIDPERFFDYYETNGWRQGKGTLIKDWKAAFRTWERRDSEFVNKTSPNIGGTDRPEQQRFEGYRSTAQ